MFLINLHSIVDKNYLFCSVTVYELRENYVVHIFLSLDSWLVILWSRRRNYRPIIPTGTDYWRMAYIYRSIHYEDGA